MLSEISKEHIEPLVVGGCILGGGGGGAIEKGRMHARLAFDLGTPKMINIDDLQDNDIVLTVANVGAPAAKNKYVKPMDSIRAIELFTQTTGITPSALITNENGGGGTVNGLLQSSITGVPVLDAACNGRAHPTGIMGSLGLTEIASYESIQAAVGGKSQTDARTEVVVRGSIKTAAKLVRQSAVQAGGVVTVVRNPVQINYLKINGAIGAISHALEVGLACITGRTALEKVEQVLDVLGGRVIDRGEVRGLKLETVNGFDVGGFHLKTKLTTFYSSFWNEYMTVNNTNGVRQTTFPDLIMTFLASTGLPVNTADLKEEDEVYLCTVPHQKIRLGSGMFCRENYKVVESIIGENIISHIEELFQDNREVNFNLL